MQFNLKPVHDAFLWLVANPTHFYMDRYVGEKWLTYDGDLLCDFVEFVDTSEPLPENISFCLCGAIIYLEAVRQEIGIVHIPAKHDANMYTVIQILQEVNGGFEVDISDELKEDLASIFGGAYFEVTYGTSLSEVTIEMLQEALAFLYAKHEYIV